MIVMVIILMIIDDNIDENNIDDNNIDYNNIDDNKIDDSNIDDNNIDDGVCSAKHERRMWAPRDLNNSTRDNAVMKHKNSDKVHIPVAYHSWTSMRATC